MKRAVIRAVEYAVAVLLFFVPVSAAHARTLYVATTATDSATCGPVLPCRSISRAIANALAHDTIIVRPGLYGDLNHNGVLGEPGEEPGSPSCACMLWVNKPVVLISSEGAAATVIDARSVDVWRNVVITAGGEFGRPGRGFTVTHTRRAPDNYGIVIDADGLQVRGNQIVSSSSFSNAESTAEVGIVAVGAGSVVIEGNQATGWRGKGIEVAGSGKTVRRNQLSLNTVGIKADGVNTVTYNVATGNNVGVQLLGATTATRNATSGGLIGFEVMGGFTGTVEENNLFGNSVCGLANRLSLLLAPHNFWGAATGPGPDPADTVCNLNSGGGVTLTAPVTTRAYVITAPIMP